MKLHGHWRRVTTTAAAVVAVATFLNPGPEQGVSAEGARAASRRQP